MKVVVYDHYDADKMNPVELELNKNDLAKGKEVELNDVTYQVMGVEFKGKSVIAILKMVKYKIANTVTSFSHKCPARYNSFKKMNPLTIDLMKEKYGKKSVESWQRDGRMKLGSKSLVNVCPDCGTAFYKDENLIPDKVEIKGTRLKKRF